MFALVYRYDEWTWRFRRIRESVFRYHMEGSRGNVLLRGGSCDRDTVGSYSHSSTYSQLSHRRTQTQHRVPSLVRISSSQIGSTIRRQPARRRLDLHLRREHFRGVVCDSARQAFWVQGRDGRLPSESRARQDLWSGRRFRCKPFVFHPLPRVTATNVCFCCCCRYSTGTLT